MSSTDFDVIVAGGGTSGCVMAARLSENADCRVLLLEAGPDFETPQDVPQALRGAYGAVLSGFNWQIPAYVQTRTDMHQLHQLVRTASVLAASPRDTWAAAKAMVHAPQPAMTSLHTIPYVPGKVIGGSSSINGAVALRPQPEDFEAWAAACGDTWSWDSVLPFFKHLERDQDFGAMPLHGSAGPVPVVRPAPDGLSPEQQRFLAACRAQGMGFIEDLNGSSGPGVGLLPSNRSGTERVSTALAYLGPARRRPNLHVRGEHQVQRILFEGRRAVGVQAWHRDRLVSFGARRVALCAGAIQTPAVLLRSGVGDTVQTRALGVAPVVHLPGVGQHLADHPAVMLWMVPRQAGPTPFENIRRFPQHQVMARACSRSGGAADLNLFFLNDFATHAIPVLTQMLGSPVAHVLSVVLARPLSRGRVSLDNAEPGSMPVVELNLGSHADDVDRLMAGVRCAWQLARSEAIQPLVQSTFLWNDTLVRSDTLLRSAVQRLVSGTWHAAGTARMGLRTDTASVVDTRCRVHGVDHLCVVDASVMPALPSTPTHLTCIMLAERAAAWLRDELGPAQ